MRECPQMAWIMSRLGEGVTEEEAGVIQRHVRECPTCQRQLRRLSWLARRLSDLDTVPVVRGEHLSDLDLAAFTARGYATDRAAAIVAHLAECRQCRREVAAVRVALDQYEEIFGEAAGDVRSRWQRMRDGLGLALSTWPRALLAVGALVSYLAECLSFAVAIAQVILAYAVTPPGFEAVPECWPLTLVPDGAARLWALVAGGLVAGVALRFVALSLYRRATRPEEK